MQHLQLLQPIIMILIQQKIEQPQNLNEFTKTICSSQYSLSMQEVKTALLKIVEQFDRIKTKQFTSLPRTTITPNNEIDTDNFHYVKDSVIIQKLQFKILQIEERRKAWDQTMTEVLNYNKKKQQTLENKLQQVKKAFDKQSQINVKKIEGIERNLLQISQNNKMLLQKYKEVSIFLSKQRQLQNQQSQLKKNEKQGVEIQKVDEIKRKKQTGSQETEQHNKQKQQEKPFRVSTQINNFEQIQNYIKENQQVMQRFQRKILKLGENLQILESKMSNAFNPINYSPKEQKHSSSNKNIPNTYQSNSNNNNLQSMNNNNQINSYFQSSNNSNMINPSSSTPPLIQQQKNQQNNWVSSRFVNRHLFLISGSFVNFIGPKSEKNSYIFCFKDSINRKNVIRIRIVETKNCYLSIGIGDQRYQFYEDCWNYDNFIFFRCYKSQIYEGPNLKISEVGHRINVGDMIKMKVNLFDYKICWYVNNRQIGHYLFNKMKNSSIVWIPILRFFDIGDGVQFISQTYQP